MKDTYEQSTGYKILQKKKFYENIYSDIAFYPDRDEILAEYLQNIVTVYLTDNEKEKVTIDDLTNWGNTLIQHKQQQIIENDIKKSVIFRICDDSDSISYSIITKTEGDNTREDLGTENFEFVSDIKDIFKSFLNTKTNKTNYNKESNVHSLSYFDEDCPPTKIYEKRINPPKLKIIK